MAFFETYDAAIDFINKHDMLGARVKTHYDDRRNCYEVLPRAVAHLA